MFFFVALNALPVPLETFKHSFINTKSNRYSFYLFLTYYVYLHIILSLLLPIITIINDSVLI